MSRELFYLLDTNVCIVYLKGNSLQVNSRFDLTLVTHNVKEFERVKGLKIEDWEEN